MRPKEKALPPKDRPLTVWRPAGHGILIALPLITLSWPAWAHGLGERYALPLPLGFYLAGAGAVVAVTFLLLLVFARTPGPDADNGGTAAIAEAGWPVPSWPGQGAMVLLIRILAASLFLVLLLAGAVGPSSPFKNPLPLSVWVLGWVGIAYVSALIGNVWALINPWDALFRFATWLIGRARGGREPKPLRPYPRRLGTWPAVAFFLVFAWMELVWPQRDHPPALVVAVLGYSAVTWGGMAVFGRAAWLRYADFLSVAFGLLARFAMIGPARRPAGGGLRLRPPAVGLLVRQPVPPSLAAFAMLMLATVTFDGLLETPPWVALAEAVLASGRLDGLAAMLDTTPYVVLTSAALLAFVALFGGCYLAISGLIAAVVGQEAGNRAHPTEIARLFVLTLMPIAIGYHLSHYLSYLLIAGQFIIPILSDPFGLGWNLFGTKLYLVDIGLVNARVAWIASLILIVGGHVVAVWLAHIEAERWFRTRRTLLRSQLPMLVLMVGYTAISLWILAQPIVKTGA